MGSGGELTTSAPESDDEAPRSPVLQTRKAPPVLENRTAEAEMEGLRKEWREAVRKRDEYLEEVHSLSMKMGMLEERNVSLVKQISELQGERTEMEERVRGMVEVVEEMRKKEMGGESGKARIEKIAWLHARRTAMMLKFQKRMGEIEKDRLVMEAEKDKQRMQGEVEMLEEKLNKLEQDKKEQEILKEEVEEFRNKIAQYRNVVRELTGERDALQKSVREKQEVIHLMDARLRSKPQNKRHLGDFAYASDKERERKIAIIDAQDAEIQTMREGLANRDAEIEALKRSLREEVAQRREAERKHLLEIQSERSKSRKEVDRLGNLFTNMLQDFALESQALHASQIEAG